MIGCASRVQLRQTPKALTIVERHRPRSDAGQAAKQAAQRVQFKAAKPSAGDTLSDPRSIWNVYARERPLRGGVASSALGGRAAEEDTRDAALLLRVCYAA
eukprot:3345120-Pleurochrysis_carterae.AAC.2